MDKDFVPEKYGMVICPLCGGRGFLIKQSDQIKVTLRKVCTKCGGFGAIKKEEEIFKSPSN
jgi:DnaJ-class molecular chaperone